MKRFFTRLFIVFLFTGIVSNLSATIIKSAGTGLAGVDWTKSEAWLNGVAPTPSDTVQIVSGDSIITSTEVGCAQLTVDGTFFLSTGKFHINGDLIVNGTVNTKATGLYCYSIINKGRIWASAATGSSSSTRSIYVGCGFTYASSVYTVTYPTGNFNVINDGRFGDFATRAAANSVAGSGISLFYSGAATSLTIKPSATNVTPVAFSIAQILPIAGQSTSNDFALNINEDIALVKYSSSAALSLQNNDIFTGSRTLNVAPGVTVFINGCLHTRNSMPTTNQGLMTYNVEGTMDFSTLATTNSLNEVQLYATPSSPNIVIRIASTGTLLLGKALKMICSTGTNQSIIINASSGANVTFAQVPNFAVATPVTITNISSPLPLSFANILNPNGISLAYSGNIAQTIDGGGKSVASLNIATTTGVTLVSPITITGSLALSQSCLTLGNNDLTVGSISSSSNKSYIITNGTGKLNLTAKTTGTLFPIGTTDGYTPATITPAADVQIAASVSKTATGSYTGYGVNSNEWTLTPASQTTATISLTPSVATYTDSPAILYGNSYASKSDATLASGVYTASAVSLNGATILATAGVNTTNGLNDMEGNSTKVYGGKSKLIVENAAIGDRVSIYTISGIKVANQVVTSSKETLSIAKGIYIVKLGNQAIKVAIK